MKRNSLVKLLVSAIATVITMATCFPIGKVYAKENSEILKALSYEFDKDSKYEISDSHPSGSSEIGKLVLGGNYKSLGEMDGFAQYDVSDGQLTLQYSYDTKILDADETSWHICNDSTKTVDGIEIDDKVGKGAIVIQTSLDGQKWATDVVNTNVFSKDVSVENPVYITKDIQLVNGCFYRIIVVYEQEMITGTSKILFVDTKEKTYRKSANVYSFYAINSSEKSLSNINSSPRKELGDKIGVKKDSGFATPITIDNKDPHYGWNIGTFCVNGYTRETTSVDGNPLFLKNAGDKVTLWFNLAKDIADLDGNGKYEIAEDKNGYDLGFEVPKTNFKHGALIIRYTDHEGVKHEPIIYTDFLAANATTGADTQAVLFEEGDYEVALDYVIKGTDIIGKENDYRISFKFSVRNGNTMFFPFDLGTGAELRDSATTESGFYIDMAKSQYLNIDVKRSVLVENANGHTEDVRFNKPAKDGNQYTDEGIYTVDVTNQYTNEHTTKKFYVGSDPFMVALAKSGMTIDELDELLNIGYIIGTDGSLIAPSETTDKLVDSSDGETQENVDVEKKDTEVISEEKSLTTKGDVPQKTTVESPNIDEPDTKVKSKNATPVVITIICLIVVGAAAVFFFVKKNKDGKPQNFTVEECEEGEKKE